MGSLQFVRLEPADLPQGTAQSFNLYVIVSSRHPADECYDWLDAGWKFALLRSAAGSHTRVVPEGFRISTRVFTSNVRELSDGAAHASRHPAFGNTKLGGTAPAVLSTNVSIPTQRDSTTLLEGVLVGVFGNQIQPPNTEFSDRLRSLRFNEDTREGEPVCRWIQGGVLLDVMPLDENILGFSNRWYKAAREASITKRLRDDREIRMVTAPYFVATKLEPVWTTPPDVKAGQASLLNLQLVSKRNPAGWYPRIHAPLTPQNESG